MEDLLQDQPTDLQEAVDYWKNLYSNLQDEFDEFQISSRELEEEMETQLDITETERDNYKRDCERFANDNDNLKEKIADTNQAIVGLQRELSKVHTEHNRLLINLRDTEQAHDDLERGKRVAQTSLGDLETQLESSMERIAFLELENGNLIDELQHLKEEFSDFKNEYSVLKQHTQDGSNTVEQKLDQPSKEEEVPHEDLSYHPTNASTTAEENKNEFNSDNNNNNSTDDNNDEENEHENRKNAVALEKRKSSNSALAVVNDILMKVMSLEQRLASCRLNLNPYLSEEAKEKAKAAELQSPGFLPKNDGLSNLEIEEDD